MVGVVTNHPMMKFNDEAWRIGDNTDRRQGTCCGLKNLKIKSQPGYQTPSKVFMAKANLLMSMLYLTMAWLMLGIFSYHFLVDAKLKRELSLFFAALYIVISPVVVVYATVHAYIDRYSK